MKLFLMGWLQVALVAIQTYFLSKSFYGGVLIGGFLISFVWSFNVKSVAFGSNLDRLIYSIGAGCGAISGLWLGTKII